MSFFGIKIPIGVDNAAFKTGLHETREYAKEFAGEIKSMFLGAFAVGAVIEGFKEFVESMAKVQDRAERFGETTETIQRVGFAAKLAGADMDLVARALSKMTIASGEAASKGGEMGEKWKTAGLEAGKFVSLGMQDKLIELSEAWERANGNTEAQVAIMGILGNRAQDLIPLLAEGPEALKEKMAEASVATDSTVKAMKHLDDSILSIKNKSVAAFSWIVNAFQTLGEVWMPRVALAFIDIYEVGAQNLKDLGILAKGLGEAIHESLHGNFRKAAEDWKKALREMDEADKSVKEVQEERIKSLGERYDEIWHGQEKPELNKGVGIEDAQEKEENLKKLASLKEEIARRERENALALMDYEHKRLELQKEIAEAQAKSNEQTIEGLEAKKTALELQGKLSELEKRHSEEQERIKERHEADLDRARDAEAKVDERNALDKMSPEEKRAYWLEKQKKLLEESADAAKRGDDVEAIQKRTQAKDLNRDISSTYDKDPDNKEKGRAVITASSLAAAGGGGYVAKGVNDPLLRAQEKGNSILERIARAVEGNTREVTPATVMSSATPPSP